MDPLGSRSTGVGDGNSRSSIVLVGGCSPKVFIGRVQGALLPSYDGGMTGCIILGMMKHFDLTTGRREHRFVDGPCLTDTRWISFVAGMMSGRKV